MWEFVWIPALAYLIGSLPSGVWLARARGASDPRVAGSGSSGATNVLRLQGAAPALAVLLLDAAKGAAAVGLARWLADDAGGWVAAAAAAGAVLGHVLPLFARFRGGKGVATSAGAALLLEPLSAVYAIGVFAVALAVTRRVSPASLAAVAAFPLFAAWRAGPVSGIGFGLAAAVVVLLAHRQNVRRLVAGAEPRLF